MKVCVNVNGEETYQISCPSFGDPQQCMFQIIDTLYGGFSCGTIESSGNPWRQREWAKEKKKGIKPLKGTEQRANFEPVK